MNVPRSRRDDVLTTKLDDEVVVYDPETKQAHSLNRVAVAVWNHADGSQTIDDLRQRVSDEVGIPVAQEAVWLALRKLEKAHLLMEKLGAGPLTRREMLGKAGRYGAAAMATPLIASALVPIAAAATSPHCGAGSGGSCAGGFVFGCDGAATCACVSTFFGTSVCTNNWFCTESPACGAGGACPPDSVCVINSCCGAPVCLPQCHTRFCQGQPGSCVTAASQQTTAGTGLG